MLSFIRAVLSVSKGLCEILYVFALASLWTVGSDNRLGSSLRIPLHNSFLTPIYWSNIINLGPQGVERVIFLPQRVAAFPASPNPWNLVPFLISPMAESRFVVCICIPSTRVTAGNFLKWASPFSVFMSACYIDSYGCTDSKPQSGAHQRTSLYHNWSPQTSSRTNWGLNLRVFGSLSWIVSGKKNIWKNLFRVTMETIPQRLEIWSPILFF